MKRFASDRVTGLMERLGLEEDVAIESRLVSRTIESAQSRVEGFNFDIRKRVVEFDDVINKQRETIYAERDKVLRNEDLTETVRAFLDDEIDVARRHATSSARIPSAWNLEGLAAALGGDGPDRRGDDRRRALGPRQPRGDREHLRDLADEQLEAKAAEVGDEDWATVERLVLLRTIDSLWVEHLTELDDMRRGIGLRGYAQQDPLNEFRREAFRLYEELRGLIRHGVASSIFRVTVTRQPPEAAGGDPAVAASLARGAAALTGGNGSRARRRGRGAAVASGGRRCAAGVARGATAGGSARRSARRTGGAGHAPGARIARRRAGRRAAAAARPLAGPSRGSRRAARGSGATTRAGAVRAPSTRSATAADRTAPRGVRTDGEESSDGTRPARGRDPRLPRDRRGRRLRDVPDLGPGPARRAAAGRRDRGHGRRPVRRPAVAGLRGPARPRDRALSGGRRAAPRRDRRQGRRRPHDRGRGRARLRDRPRRPGGGDPRRGPQPDDARSIRAVGDILRDNGSASTVFVSDRPHMLRVLRMAADDGITAWGSPTGTSPIEGDPMRRADATVHELLALVQYFLVGRSALSVPSGGPPGPEPISLLAGGVWPRILCQNPPISGPPRAIRRSHAGHRRPLPPAQRGSP